MNDLENICSFKSSVTLLFLKDNFYWIIEMSPMTKDTVIEIMVILP